MAQLHALQKQADRLQRMLEEGHGCRPCIENALKKVQQDINRMMAKESKDGN